MSIIENAKEIARIVQQIDNVDLYRKILDLHAEIIELYDQNRGLREENGALKEKVKFKEALVYEDKAYWVKMEDSKDGPFCSSCWDAKQLTG